MDKKLPTVSLLIVVKNEAQYIPESLQSLLEQTYSRELTEFIFVDGMSTDGTREWLKTKVEELRESGIDAAFFDNPKGTLAAGWNIGVRKAKGDVVCRIDAHSRIDPGYIEKGIDELMAGKDDGVVCVGGVLENVGYGFTGKAIADMVSSKFGVGNSDFRVNTGRTVFTDTAVFGLYRRWVFEKVGYFDESLKRNQDIALHGMILDAGYRFVTCPDMKAVYHVRNTVPGLVKKAFSDGYWVMYLDKPYLRHKIPLLFTGYVLSIPFIMLVSGVLGLLDAGYWCLLPVVFYFILAVCFSLKDGRSFGKLLLPFLFPIFHISYGLGSFKGVIDRLK